ncbi:hypothetical protein QQG55_49645 [Brugia pahangi]
MYAEHDLIGRTLNAIELLIEKQINYFFILENYQIMEALRQIAQNQNNCYDIHVKARARQLLNKESDYKMQRIPANTYILIR